MLELSTRSSDAHRKSVSRTLPSSRMITWCGLRSRWTTPRRCTSASAPAIFAPSSTARAGVRNLAADSVQRLAAWILQDKPRPAPLVHRGRGHRDDSRRPREARQDRDLVGDQREVALGRTGIARSLEQHGHVVAQPHRPVDDDAFALTRDSTHAVAVERLRRPIREKRRALDLRRRALALFTVSACGLGSDACSTRSGSRNQAVHDSGQDQ